MRRPGSVAALLGLGLLAGPVEPDVRRWTPEAPAPALPRAHDLARYPFGLHVITQDLAGPVDVGARWTRHAVLWKDVEPRKGEIRGLEEAVPRLNELSAAGFEILPRLLSVNPWAEEERINRLNAEAAARRAPMGATTYLGMPTDLSAYRRFLTTVVEAFDGDGTRDARGLRKGIRYWQVENEWDWRWKDTPPRFVELLKVAYETIKAADPGATVVLGGISKLAPDAFHAGLLGESRSIHGRVVTPQSLSAQRHFQEEHPLRTYVLEHGHPYFDVISFHQYGRPQAVEKEVDYLRGIMRRRNYEKPLWITEAGGPFAPYGEDYSEDRQAREVVKHYVTALASGVEVVFWSTYAPTPEWGRAFTNTALLDGHRKKPAYEAYKLTASKLADASRVETLWSGEGGRLVRFARRSRAPVYVGWSDVGLVGLAPRRGGRGPGGPAAERLRALLAGAPGTVQVTGYDGTVRTVRDLPAEADGLLRKGPAFIEVREGGAR